MKRRHLTPAFILLVAFGRAAAAQESSPEITRLFEGGHYQQVVDAAGPEAPPQVVFTAAMSQQKLGAPEQAVALARRLGALPEEDPWHFIGLSMEQLAAGDTDGALVSADRSVAMNPGLATAHYQRGLVLVRREAWREAALAFDEVSTIEPAYAYAYYYGGLAYSRARRPDLMAVRFERFLKLAPEAPERPEVLQIMRTLRGR